MRRLFVLLLLTLAAAATLAWLVRLDAGYVLVQFHGTSLETSVWFALAALLATLLLFYYAARLLVGALDGLSRLAGRAPRAPRRLLSGSTARGAIAFAEGHWKRAARLLAAGARRSDAPLLNHLLAARAAQRAGDAALARGFLALAEGVSGARAAVATERARVELALGDPAAALAALDALPGDPPPAAIGLLLEILTARAEWERLLELLPQARRLAVREPAALDALEARAGASLLERAGTQPDAVRATWDSLSAATRANPALVERCALALQDGGAGAEAAQLLEAALATRWEPALVRALGRVRDADPLRQLGRMERLLAKHPGDAALLLALGRVAAAGQLWGKARDYLESGLAREPGAEALAELARLCDRHGQPERARELYARLAAMVAPELHASRRGTTPDAAKGSA